MKSSITDFVASDYVKFSPASLRDLTRISNSPPVVWADIFLSNKKNLLQDTQRYIKSLKKFTKALRKGDKAKIIKLIKGVNAKQKLL